MRTLDRPRPAIEPARKPGTAGLVSEMIPETVYFGGLSAAELCAASLACGGAGGPPSTGAGCALLGASAVAAFAAAAVVAFGVLVI